MLRRHVSAMSFQGIVGPACEMIGDSAKAICQGMKDLLGEEEDHSNKQERKRS